MLNVEKFIQEVKSFAEGVSSFVGVFELVEYEPILAKQFHQTYKELKTGTGIYIFADPDSGRVLYVGESENIFGRFIRHIGSGYKFGGEGECFPNFGLAKIYHWAKPETKQILRSGNFNVFALEVNPPQMRWLLESFLIAYGRANGSPPELNVRG